MKNGEPSGICSCCGAVTACSYLKDPSKPVLQCEDLVEFQVHRSSAAEGKTILTSTPVRWPDIAKPDSVRHTGLCSICEEFHSCTFEKPEGGVWHCEEYR